LNKDCGECMLYPNSFCNNSRIEALTILLRPIEWSLESPISYRQNLVRERHNDVRLIWPFLNKIEREQAAEWIKREAHSDVF
jgi:hypothetical protein